MVCSMIAGNGGAWRPCIGAGEEGKQGNKNGE
jgi:hypothetical protein